MLPVSVPEVLFVFAISAPCLGLISRLLAGARVTVVPRDDRTRAWAKGASADDASATDRRAPMPDARPEHQAR